MNNEKNTVTLEVDSPVLKTSKPKYITSIMSMGITLLLYGWLLKSWWLGIGLVLSILIHELGHFWAARQKGYSPELPVFIPLVGAFVKIPSGLSPKHASYIAYAGPFVGGIFALILLLVWALLPTQVDALFIIAYFGIALNLLNLFPIEPLDGGKILKIAEGWVIRWVAIGLLICVLAYMQFPGSIVLLGVLVFSHFPVSREKSILLCILTFAAITTTALQLGYKFDFWFIVVFACAGLVKDYLDLQASKKVKKTEKAVDGILHELAKQQIPAISKNEVAVWVIAYYTLLVVLLGALLYTHPIAIEMLKVLIGK